MLNNDLNFNDEEILVALEKVDWFKLDADEAKRLGLSTGCYKDSFEVSDRNSTLSYEYNCSYLVLLFLLAIGLLVGISASHLALSIAVYQSTLIVTSLIRKKMSKKAVKLQRENFISDINEIAKKFPVEPPASEP